MSAQRIECRRRGYGMQCPVCGCHKTRVIESRQLDNAVIRIRRCLEGHRFNTTENVDP